ncbi:hypothetical protein ACHAPA_000398 [Fusarium lateritium]
MDRFEPELHDLRDILAADGIHGHVTLASLPARPFHPVLNVPVIEYMFPLDEKITEASIKGYPNDIPRPQDPMLINRIYKSAAYVKARDEDVELSKPGQLAASEVDCMARHLREFEESHPDNNKKLFLFTQGDLQYFLQAIFHEWNSSMDIADRPELRPRFFNEYAVRAGSWVNDLPAVPGSTGNEEKLPGRLSGDIAYLAITVRDMAVGGALITEWKDKYGADVDISRDGPRAISGVVPRNTVARAIRNYDECERERVMRHNFDLAIWCARRQIIEFAKTGVKEGAGYLRPELYTPQKLVLAKAHVQDMVTFLSTVLAI